MKNLFCLLVILFLTSFNYAKAQIVDYNHVVWTVVQPEDMDVDQYMSSYYLLSDDLVTFQIEPKSSYDFWRFRVKNNTDEKLTIKWKEAVMGSYSTSRVLFGDMMRLEINNELPDGILYKSGSIDREIGGEEYARNAFLKLVDVNLLKETYKKKKVPQTIDVNIIIPIEYNNEIYTYHIILRGTYQGKIKKK